MTAPQLRLAVRALFLCSGAVALGLEAAWFRRMVPVFGASHSVSALLLAVYMSGLAIGAALAARFAARARSALRAYALCEALVAASAIASIPAFLLIERTRAGSSLALSALSASLVLVLPTSAMGATTPLLVRALTHHATSLRATLSSLYAINLVGASLGAIATGFVLLPRLGIRAVISLWSALGLCVALTALALSRRHSEGPIDDAPAPPPSSPPRASSTAVATAIALGALSFALQVSLGRVAALLLGSTAYTFELLAAVILVALSVGATAARHDESAEAAWSSVSRRCVRIAVAVFLAMLVVRIAPVYVQLAVRARSNPAPLRLALISALALWPYYEIGALFPTVATRIESRDGATTAGIATAAVTAGNVVGALVAGFVAIPSLGLQATLRAIALAALAIAVITAAITNAQRARSTIIASSLAVLVGSLLDRPWDAVALSAGTFRTALNRSLHESPRAPCGPGRALPETRVLFSRDGSLGTVTVLSHSDRALCTLYSLRVNGKTEGSVFVPSASSSRGAASTPREQWLPVGDLPSELFVGQALEAVAHRPLDRAFMVGWGTGISARALQTLAPRSIIATEIEPVVIDASRLFDPQLHHDRTVSILRDDARRTLRSMPERSIDALVSHPSNPWVTGATALFSREFFQLVRSRLRDDGSVLAWVQLYEIDLDGVRSLVHTFVETFPNAIALRTDARSRDLFLIATRASAPLDRTRIQAALSTRAAIVGDGAALERWSRTAPVVTDDNALLEFRVADVMLSGREDPRVLALEGL
ncbi:MAG: fused MFS/spermidine synthase [Polyangiales bacterium]